MAMPADPPFVSLRNISKSFGNLQALSGVDLDLYPGRCHALMGENGAGKSTLIKIIGGLTRPDEGTISIEGSQHSLNAPAESLRLGISVVPQELIFVPGMSVAENISLGDLCSRSGFVQRRTLVDRSEEILARLGVHVDCRARLGDLSPAVQQLAMIARGLSRDARLLVLDEPTATLADEEIEQLFTVLSKLKQAGIAILYVSHRMNELREIAEDVTVLRDGQNVASWIGEGVPDDDRLIQAMVGRSVQRFFSADRQRPAGKREVLRVEGLSRQGVLHDVSLTLHAGEIVALTGLMGSGRTEVLRSIAGVDRPDSLRMFIEGSPVSIRNPRDAQQAGMVLVPEERKTQGLVESMSVADNISLPHLRRWSTGPLLFDRARRRAVTGIATRVGLRTEKYAAPARSLSGGNQQKVVLGKALLGDPKIILLDEPTRGIDIAVKHEIYALIGSLADNGCAVLVVSSEMPEVLGLADRVIVLKDGRAVGELDGSQATENSILELAMLGGPTNPTPVNEPPIAIGGRTTEGPSL